MKALTLKELNQAVLTFNRVCPEGSAVVVTLDDGTKRPTKTVGEAWVMGGHSAVVLLEGISGAYRLDRVQKV